MIKKILFRYLILISVITIISCEPDKDKVLQEDELVIDFIENVKSKSAHTERIINRHGGEERFPEFTNSITSLRNVLGNIKMVYKYGEVNKTDSLLQFETKGKDHRVYRDTINYLLNKGDDPHMHIDICFWSLRMLDHIESEVHDSFWHIDSLKPLVVHEKDENSNFYKCYMVARPFGRGTKWYAGHIDTTSNQISSYDEIPISSKDPYYAIYPVKGRTGHDTIDVAWRQVLPYSYGDTLVILEDVIKY